MRASELGSKGAVFRWTLRSESKAGRPLESSRTRRCHVSIVRDFFGGRARLSRSTGVRRAGLGCARGRAPPLRRRSSNASALRRTARGGASIRLVERPLTSSEARARSMAGSEDDLPGPDVSAPQAARPFGVVRPGGAQTTASAASRRAEGAGAKTLEAGQGQERVPDRFTATRQLGRRTPRRVRIVTWSR